MAKVYESRVLCFSQNVLVFSDQSRHLLFISEYIFSICMVSIWMNPMSQLSGTNVIVHFAKSSSSAPATTWSCVFLCVRRVAFETFYMHILHIQSNTKLDICVGVIHIFYIRCHNQTVMSVSFFAVHFCSLFLSVCKHFCYKKSVLSHPHILSQYQHSPLYHQHHQHHYQYVYVVILYSTLVMCT